MFGLHNKTDPLVDEVELLQANPHYTAIQYQNGKEDIVSTEHLAPAGSEYPAQSQDITGTAPMSKAPETAVMKAVHEVIKMKYFT